MNEWAQSERTRPVWRAHGLLVASDDVLPGLRAVPGDTTPDAMLRWCGCSRVGGGLPPGRQLLRHDVDGRPRCTASLAGRTYTLRFADCCEFRFERRDPTVVGRMQPDVDPAIGRILAAGALLAFMLTVSNATVLHASAVQGPDGVIALVGGSGSGKSTTAALLCAAGLPLVADDVLRLDLEGERVSAYAGATTVRLRPKAWSIAQIMPAPITVADTIDGRRAVGVPSIDVDRLPLAAVCRPRPRRDIAEVATRRLTPDDALLCLLSSPRFPGWQAADVLRPWFEQMSDLAQRVPVYEIDIPWGPPFSQTVVASLRDALTALVPEVEPSVAVSSARRAS